jgi:hypothetical protein
MLAGANHRFSVPLCSIPLLGINALTDQWLDGLLMGMPVGLIYVGLLRTYAEAQATGDT